MSGKQQSVTFDLKTNQKNDIAIPDGLNQHFSRLDSKQLQKIHQHLELKHFVNAMNNYFFYKLLFEAPMSSRKGQKYRKESFQDQSNGKRIDSESFNQRLRVIQNNLVFINGLPSSLSSKEILETEKYFARYGKVQKIIVNPPQPFKKNVTYQAYVTYENQLEASLAIVALDGFKVSERPLKVSYGTTKYCTYFIKGSQCPNSDCFYLHKLDKKREVLNGDTKSQFKQQNNAAIDVVLNNLDYLIEQQLKQNNKDEDFQDFPTLSQIIDFLLDSNLVTQAEIDQTYYRVKNKPEQNQKIQTLQVPQQIMKTKSQFLSPTDSSPKQNKLVKSSSFSTACSPVKPQQIQNKQTDNTQKQVNFKIEEKIEKLLLKQLLKNNNKECKSRFKFVIDREKRNVVQQCNRIKGIVQQYLIAKN